MQLPFDHGGTSRSDLSADLGLHNPSPTDCHHFPYDTCHFLGASPIYGATDPGSFQMEPEYGRRDQWRVVGVGLIALKRGSINHQVPP